MCRLQTLYMHRTKFLAAVVYGKIKGHNRSVDVQFVKAWEHDIARREALVVFKISIWMSHIREKVLIDFGKGKRSIGFTRG